MGLELSGSSLAVRWLNFIQRWVQNSDSSDGSSIVGALDWLSLIFFLAVSVGLQFTVSIMKSS